jgi:hypothetical protein
MLPLSLSLYPPPSFSSSPFGDPLPIVSLACLLSRLLLYPPPFSVLLNTTYTVIDIPFRLISERVELGEDCDGS